MCNTAALVFDLRIQRGGEIAQLLTRDAQCLYALDQPGMLVSQIVHHPVESCV